MLWHVWRYFSSGEIESLYITPKFHFSYWGFEWVRPWPGIGMYLHFFVMGLLAAAILVGLHYRVCTVLFWLAFTYQFLLDKCLYQNHYYLISLISFLLIFLPAHRAASLDAWLRPAIRSDVVPAWTLWLLRAQIGIPYFFGGIAKLNPDWLRCEPMRQGMAEPHRTGIPLIGQWFTQEWMVVLFSYGGLLLDLCIVPLLLWRRTRLIAFCFALRVPFPELDHVQHRDLSLVHDPGHVRLFRAGLAAAVGAPRRWSSGGRLSPSAASPAARLLSGPMPCAASE